jgi:hypothetical protein
MGTKTIVELIFAILMALSLHGDVDQQAKNGHRSGLISDSHRSGPISDSHVVSKAVVDGESSRNARIVATEFEKYGGEIQQIRVRARHVRRRSSR